jgi:vacuolar-type H+-ATPase subunit C/Vma6
MKLLQNPADRGYPADYLLARIKGRRAGLIRDWRPFIYGTALAGTPLPEKASGLTKAKPRDGTGGILLREYRWVYFQMNRQLREIFYPFFLYAELRTVYACLRRLKDKKAGALGDLLAHSLLSEAVKKVLLVNDDLKHAVAGLEHLFSTLSPGFSGLTKVLETGGLRGIEQRLTERFLAEAAGFSPHPMLKTFFSRIIDARNILALAKFLRFELKTAPAPIPGGTIPAARLRDAARTKNFASLEALVNEAAGVRPERPEPPQVERALYQGITKWLKRTGRDPFGAAPILDYLWRCSIEAMNMNVLYYGRDVEREVIAAELVR